MSSSPEERDRQAVVGVGDRCDAISIGREGRARIGVCSEGASDLARQNRD
jgi:hypothetical protein